MRVLPATVLSLLCAVSTATSAPLSQAIKEHLSGKEFASGVTAISVVDGKTGLPLFERNETEALNTASNVKLLSVAATLDVLGNDFRYETKIIGPAPTNGVVEGDVYLLGSNDPTLRSKHLRRLAQQLKEAGIHQITGDIFIGFDSHRDAINSDRVYLALKSESRKSGKVTYSMSPNNTYVDVLNEMSAARKTRLAIETQIDDEHTDGERFQIKLKGTLRWKRRKTIRRRITNKPLFTAHIFRAALGQSNIRQDGFAHQVSFESFLQRTPNVVDLAVHRSAKLSSIAAWVNKRSLNWLSDRILATAAGVAANAPARVTLGTELMRDWYASRFQNHVDDLIVTTGSGLSYKTKMSTSQIVDIIRAASGMTSDTLSETHKAFRRSLSIPGRDGTLRRRFYKLAARKFFTGKTGTLTQVIATSGILKVKDRELVVSIVTNGNIHKRRRHLRKAHDALINAIYLSLTEPKDADWSPKVAAASEPSP